MGPCTPHWPPPLGTKILTIPALIKVNIGNVVVLEMLTKKSENTFTNPELFIIPIMPKYKGNCMRIPLAPTIAWLTPFKKLLKFLCKIIPKPSKNKLMKFGVINERDNCSGIISDLYKQ